MPKELKPPPQAQRDPNALHMASIWIAEKGLHCALNIGVFDENARVDEVRAWGIMLADIARHVSQALPHTDDGSERSILNRIWASFDEELSKPTSPVSGGFLPSEN